MADGDRRAYDPYAPHPRGDLTPMDAESEPYGEPTSLPDAIRDNLATESEAEPTVEPSSGDDLDSMRRVDLLKVADDEEIPAYGNRESLIERIRKARAARQG